jgi:hypothetical protein
MEGTTCGKAFSTAGGVRQVDNGRRELSRLRKLRTSISGEVAGQKKRAKD